MKRNNLQDYIYQKYGQGIDRALWESLRAHNAFTLDQTTFRPRVDDSAADNSPTWIEAVNTDWTQAVDNTFRIRFTVTESGGDSSGTFGGQLQYNLASGGWNNVTGTSPIQYATGAVTDGRATGAVLSSATNFVAGSYDDNAGNVTDISLPKGEHTEVEYNLTIDSAQVTNGQTFQLKVIGKGGDTGDLDSYTNTPTVTVAEGVNVAVPQGSFTLTGNVPTVTAYEPPTALSDCEFPTQNSYIGPFETASKKYIVLFDETASKIVMMSTTSASPADGDWSMEDVSIDITGGKSLYAAGQSPNIHVVHQESSGLVEYHVFSTSSNTWTTTNEEVASTSDTIFDNAPGEFGTAIGVRSTGVPVVAFLYGDSTGPQDEVGWVSRTGGSWGTPATMYGGAEVESVFCTGVDSSDRVYFYSNKPTATIATYLQNVLSGDTLGTYTQPGFSTLDTANSIIIHSNETSAGRPQIFWLESTDKIKHRDVTPADTPSGFTSQTSDITDNTVYGNGRTLAPYIAACATVTGTDKHILYADSATQDIYHDSDTGSGWGTDTELVDAVTCNRISCRYGSTSDAILYVYEDGSTVKFGSLSLTTGVDIAAATNTFTLTGNVPTIATGASVAVPQGSFTLAAYAPEVGTGASVDSPDGTFTLTAYEPAIATGVGIESPAGAFTLTGYEPSIETGVNIDVPQGTLSLTGYEPVIGIGVLVDTPQGAFTLSPQTPEVGTGALVTLPAEGTFTITAYEPEIGTGAAVLPPAGAFTLTGYEPSIQTGVSIAVPETNFSLTGYEPAVVFGINLEAPAGAFTLSTFAPTVETGVNIDVPQGAFTLTPNAPEVGTGVDIAAPAGALTLTAYEPTVSIGVNIEVGEKNFTISAFSPTISTGAGIDAPSGVFTLTGFGPSVETGVNIELPAAGAFTLTGFSPGITAAEGIEVIVPLAVFSLTSSPPEVATGVSVAPPAQAYSLTGYAPGVTIGAGADFVAIRRSSGHYHRQASA